MAELTRTNHGALVPMPAPPVPPATDPHEWHAVAGRCRFCRSTRIVGRESASSDFEDWQYECMDCGGRWWEEGADA